MSEELGLTVHSPDRHWKLHSGTYVSVLMEIPGIYKLSKQTGPHQPNKGWLYMDIKHIIKKIIMIIKKKKSGYSP